MTHKSYANEGSKPEENNERLEFLGDAILTFLCGEFLYKKYPKLAEGELTPLRASLVDKHQLAEFAKSLNLDQKLRLGKGVENSGGRQNPRLLSSAFEALIGAYFLDQDSSVDAVRVYVEPFFADALRRRGADKSGVNAKSQFQEWATAKLKEFPQYRLIEASGPDHARHFVVEVTVKGQVYGRGQGRKKQEAEKEAARIALEKLGLL